ncbi:hypothetical protein ACF1A5_26290 [Streptomyces sp. NPDC014864]|uniref:hypothetical protein n=1 Tax=Streptomyces sp. NPDC014864 TaxID=3364924 RepID=UPI0036FE9B8C
MCKLGQNESPADMASQARAFRDRGRDSMDRLADCIERHDNLPRQEPGHGPVEPADAAD